MAPTNQPHNRRLGLSWPCTLLYAHVLVAAGMAVAFATLLVPHRVDNEAQSVAVPLGLPFPFVTQDMSRLDPPSWPRYYRIALPQEYPTTFEVWPFIADTALAALTLGVLVFAAGRCVRAARNRTTRRTA